MWTYLMVYKCFDKKSSGIENVIIYNKELAEVSTNQLLENLRKEKYIHLLWKKFREQM